jgi:hypothetical protein
MPLSVTIKRRAGKPRFIQIRLYHSNSREIPRTGLRLSARMGMPLPDISKHGACSLVYVLDFVRYIRDTSYEREW